MTTITTMTSALKNKKAGNNAGFLHLRTIFTSKWWGKLPRIVAATPCKNYILKFQKKELLQKLLHHSLAAASMARISCASALANSLTSGAVVAGA